MDRNLKNSVLACLHEGMKHAVIILDQLQGDKRIWSWKDNSLGVELCPNFKDTYFLTSLTHLPNCIKNSSISGVQSFVLTWYFLCSANNCTLYLPVTVKHHRSPCKILYTTNKYALECGLYRLLSQKAPRTILQTIHTGWHVSLFKVLLTSKLRLHFSIDSV